MIGHGNLKVINFASMQRQCITVNHQKLNLLVSFVEKLYAKLPCQDTWGRVLLRFRIQAHLSKVWSIWLNVQIGLHFQVKPTFEGFIYKIAILQREKLKKIVWVKEIIQYLFSWNKWQKYFIHIAVYYNLRNQSDHFHWLGWFLPGQVGESWLEVPAKVQKVKKTKKLEQPV